MRRGIDRLSKRFGEGDDDSGESENDAPSRKGKGKAKEVMVEIIRDGQAEETEEVKTTVIPSKGERKAEIKAAEQGKRKGKLPKKVNLLSMFKYKIVLMIIHNRLDGIPTFFLRKLLIHHRPSLTRLILGMILPMKNQKRQLNLLPQLNRSQSLKPLNRRYRPPLPLLC